MKKVIIIHGWSGFPEEGWFPWIKERLEENDFVVQVPKMPNPDHPVIKSWVSHLKSIAGKPDENTYFIGHSIGCQTILRYLEALPENYKIGGVILVAPWLILTDNETKEEKEIGKSWIETQINFEKIKKHTNNFISIFSDDDAIVPIENKKLFEKKLNTKTFILRNTSAACCGDKTISL